MSEKLKEKQTFCDRCEKEWPEQSKKTTNKESNIKHIRIAQTVHIDENNYVIYDVWENFGNYFNDKDIKCMYYFFGCLIVYVQTQ